MGNRGSERVRRRGATEAETENDLKLNPEPLSLHALVFDVDRQLKAARAGLYLKFSDLIDGTMYKTLQPADFSPPTIFQEASYSSRETQGVTVSLDANPSGAVSLMLGPSGSRCCLLYIPSRRYLLACGNIGSF